MPYPEAIVPVGHVEPCPRRIRAILNGATVLDTCAALYQWEWPHYPRYQIPVADIDPDVLRDGGEPHTLRFGSATAVDLTVGDVARPRAGRRYVSSSTPQLVDTVRFDWDALDGWFEEDEQVFVHPRSPYSRVDALRSRRDVRVSRDGAMLAQSDATVMVFETGLPPRCYFDRADVDFSHLRRSQTVTACPYKGRTSDTWSVVVGEHTYADLAWSYAFPTLALAPIAGLVAFYDEQVDVEMDGVAQPRPDTHFSR